MQQLVEKLPCTQIPTQVSWGLLSVVVVYLCTTIIAGDGYRNHVHYLLSSTLPLVFFRFISLPEPLTSLPWHACMQLAAQSSRSQARGKQHG